MENIFLGKTRRQEGEQSGNSVMPSPAGEGGIRDLSSMTDEELAISTAFFRYAHFVTPHPSRHAPPVSPAGSVTLGGKQHSVVF